MRETVDYIVVFGAAVGSDGKPSTVLRHRLDAALRSAEGRSRVRLLVTGGLGKQPPTEAEAMSNYLQDRGLLAGMILTEPEGVDTLSSSVRCLEILQRQSDANSVVVCSSSFHLPRCRMIFRILGLPTERVAIPSDRKVLGTVRWLRASLREGPAIVLDAALALGWRLRNRQSPPVQGSILVLISVILSAGKPLLSA